MHLHLNNSLISSVLYKMNNLKRITRRSFFTSLGLLGGGLGFSLNRINKSDSRSKPLLNKKLEGRFKKPTGILKTETLS
jgi:hypothetical protein